MVGSDLLREGTVRVSCWSRGTHHGALHHGRASASAGSSTATSATLQRLLARRARSARNPSLRLTLRVSRAEPESASLRVPVRRHGGAGPGNTRAGA